MKNKVPFKTSISEEIAVTLDRPINFEKKFHCLILLTENKPIGNLKKLYVSGKLQNLEKVKKTKRQMAVDEPVSAERKHFTIQRICSYYQYSSMNECSEQECLNY